MGSGGSSTPGPTQVSATKSKTEPWKAAQPLLKDLISQYMGMDTGVTSGQTNALENINQSVAGIPNFGADATGAVQNLFSSDTTPQQGMLKEALTSIQGNLGPTASGAELDPYNTPGFSDALRTMMNDTTDKVKGVYAGAGRAPSGAGSFAGSLGRGITQGISPVIAAQFNQNKQNQMAANKTLFDASGNTASGVTQQEQVPLTNAVAGLNAIPGAATAYTVPGSTMLNAANAEFTQPYGNLGTLLAPAATLGGMGSTSSGTQTTTSTQPVNQFSNILGGIAGGAGILSLFSDERLKEGVDGAKPEKIGKLHDGQDVVSFKYKGDPVPRMGLLAQDVEQFAPEAVSKVGPAGMLAVDHRLATRRAAAIGRRGGGITRRAA